MLAEDVDNMLMQLGIDLEEAIRVVGIGIDFVAGVEVLKSSDQHKGFRLL